MPLTQHPYAGKVVFVFTRQGGESTDKTMSRKDIETAANSNGGIAVVYADGEVDEIINNFAHNSAGVVMVADAQSTEECSNLNTAKQQDVDVVYSSMMPRIVQSWTGPM